MGNLFWVERQLRIYPLSFAVQTYLLQYFYSHSSYFGRCLSQRSAALHSPFDRCVFHSHYSNSHSSSINPLNTPSSKTLAQLSEIRCFYSRSDVLIDGIKHDGSFFSLLFTFACSEISLWMWIHGCAWLHYRLPQLIYMLSSWLHEFWLSF